MVSNRYDKMTSSQRYVLVVLRVLIGWHMLYEGIVKVLNPNWSSAGYLLDAQWLLSGFFHRIAADPNVLKVVDVLNAWGLVLIGAALMLGFLTRAAGISGIVLLALYYISQIPLPGLTYAMASEGSALIVNKTLLELVGLLAVVLFRTEHAVGIDLLISRKKNALKKDDQ